MRGRSQTLPTPGCILAFTMAVACSRPGDVGPAGGATETETVPTGTSITDETQSTSGTTGGPLTAGTSGAGSGTGSTTSGSGGGSSAGGTEPCGPVPPDMVCVPAGLFWMGCNDAVDDVCLQDPNPYQEEFPYREVDMAAFLVDKTEVTVAAYRNCIDDTACVEPADCDWDGAGDDHPVGCLQWVDAAAYCDWAGKRLPSETEWEKAARGTDGRIYPWGNTDPTCNEVGAPDCGPPATQPVGSKPAGASPYGTMDMAGNVMEWVADWFDADYYTRSPSSDPPGPVDGQRRVLRGGGGAGTQEEEGFRSSRRYDGDPAGSNVFKNHGVRCALGVP